MIFRSPGANSTFLTDKHSNDFNSRKNHLNYFSPNNDDKIFPRFLNTDHSLITTIKVSLLEKTGKISTNAKQNQSENFKKSFDIQIQTLPSFYNILVESKRNQ